MALTRKNALSAGNAVNWAMLASLVATCKMSDVNPADCLADTLRALLDGHSKSRIEEFMSWQFREATPTQQCRTDEYQRSLIRTYAPSPGGRRT